ncbi:restriction endonuclease PLD domain-containing protein [Haloglomus halophilum]|uniref:restriction endonuclease PLD domain-containing protein n=1 Tax=Haloglomus halophilum TaxID=2962672 RepID=UPI0020CA2065|nr:restriction endonuclease PLD domain-containing protein [Haloglomus halophilum]
MEEVTANISFDRFADMPEFYGSGAASYRLAMVKRREDFLDIFEGAAHVDAITYADTPELMVRMLTEYDIGSLDVLVGNADDYAEQVNEVATARELVDLRQQDRLTVRLKNQKTVHSKMYRVVMPDETVKLIHGSANLSVNSWQYHTNQISVITTEVGTELDEEFLQFIDEYRETYSSQTLLEGLVEALEEADSNEEREERIEYWVGAGDLELSDTAALNQDAIEDLEEVADHVTAVVEDPDEADETVAFVEEPENADRSVVEPSGADNGDGTTEASTDDDSGEANDGEPESASDGNEPAESPDIGLVESAHETGLGDSLDRPRVRAPDRRVRIGTNRVDPDTADEFGASLQDKGATVEDHSIMAPLSAYNQQVKESTKIPTMTVLPESNQVVIGEKEDMILVATESPDPEVLDHCLSTIEEYLETVDDHGYTQNSEAIMAQMYEAFLYGFWAPFANQYAESLSSPSRTLDNVLQHLYIQGKSDAGKDKLTEYILRLLSDNMVTSGVDGDSIGVKEVRGVREWDTCFPYAIIDAEKDRIEDWGAIRNYWSDWTPTSVDQPCLIFTTNDALPKSEFRNRMKILNMDVSFPSNPEDPGFHEAQEDLSEVLEQENPIFSYVARRMVREEPWTDGTGTIEDVRHILNDFYEEADRPKPDYFPAEKPAEKTYDTGRMKWQRDIRGGRVTFEPEPDGIEAKFKREKYEVFDYEKRLSKRFMSDQSGSDVFIGDPEAFAEWVGYSVDELLEGVAEQAGEDEDEPEETGPEEAQSDQSEDSGGGLLSRLLGR